MKSLLRIITPLLIIAYLVAVSGFISAREETLQVRSVDITVKDSAIYQFISSADILGMLNRNGLNARDRLVRDANLGHIESFLYTQQMVKKAEAYVTEPGILHIEVRQKKPFLRIINALGNGYYLDREGNVIPLSSSFSPYVLVASGMIREPFRLTQTTNIFEADHDSLPRSQRVIYDLFNLAGYIADDDFWNSQIEQVYVNTDYEFELVPRVGSHIIEFGTADDIGEKFANLELLYKEGLNNLGWNQYSRINLKYKNQVVCTKIQ